MKTATKKAVFCQKVSDLLSAGASVAMISSPSLFFGLGGNLREHFEIGKRQGVFLLPGWPGVFSGGDTT
ncbi:hypothetical protein MTR62_15390 [Novosphingobium sp. 1949]|uniref:Uncharacterized protein n=1 Tax=Novosphingobium organovorum TaxID=2930092 RepID=A0ABT0BGV8_9SPHN|nr:hypothetical protein [Novosphingobium organovorum]MCJ2184068.1 hypothetical protein [Novosphingobium organovorum]